MKQKTLKISSETIAKSICDISTNKQELIVSISNFFHCLSPIALWQSAPAQAKDYINAWEELIFSREQGELIDDEQLMLWERLDLSLNAQSLKALRDFFNLLRATQNYIIQRQAVNIDYIAESFAEVYVRVTLQYAYQTELESGSVKRLSPLIKLAKNIFLLEILQEQYSLYARNKLFISLENLEQYECNERLLSGHATEEDYQALRELTEGYFANISRELYELQPIIESYPTELRLPALRLIDEYLRLIERILHSDWDISKGRIKGQQAQKQEAKTFNLFNLKGLFAKSK